MALETGDFIVDLVITNPPGSDQLSTADDHLRLIKKAVKQSFPNVGSEVSASAGELNRVVGLTSTIEQQANRSASDGYASLDSNRKVPLDLMHPTVLRKDTAASISAAWTFESPLNFKGQVDASATANFFSAVNFTGAVTGVGKSITYDARTSNTQLVFADRGNLIDITSGTFSQTFAAVSVLGSGWFIYMRNSGTGDITLEPDGSETIDGLTNFVMYPGEVRLIQCDGSALRSFVIKGFSRTYTSSGTFTKPPGYTEFSGLLWGAGGGGGNSTSTGHSGGGGGGACVPFTLQASGFGATETVTIGAGGTDPGGDGDGSAGGNSTLGSLVTAYGGGGGAGSTGSSNEGGGGGGGSLSAGTSNTGTGSADGGEPSVNDPDNSGFGGGRGGADTNSGGKSHYGGGGGDGGSGSFGGESFFGGAGGGGSNAGTGGTSLHGGNGGAGSDTGNGTAGTAPAGGGGGTRTGSTSGAGARGELRIWGLV